MDPKKLLEEDGGDPQDVNINKTKDISQDISRKHEKADDEKNLKQSEISRATGKSNKRSTIHNKGSHIITADEYAAKHQYGEISRDEDEPEDDSLPDPLKRSTLAEKRAYIAQQEKAHIKKLSPLKTYFSLLKGFIATGILYMPKNFKNAGWLWALISMFLSYGLTLVCINKLLQTRARYSGSFTDLGFKALGLKGKYMVDIFLGVMQVGFLIGQIYFICVNLRSVLLEAGGVDIHIAWFGLFTFLVITPLSFFRKIEVFAFSYVFADILVLVTTITILVFATIHTTENGWGQGVQVFNDATWLSMIGSAVYAYEGIGIVLPLLDVTERPDLFPKILFLVLTTVFILYTGFGEYCYFVYGQDLKLPLITANLPPGVLVYIVQVAFSINLIITCPLQAYPVNLVIESYLFKNLKASKKRTWLKNISRTVLSAISISICLGIGDTVDKLLSLNGTVACTPISFMIPAIFHLKLCEPTKNQKIVDYFIIGLSIAIIIFCSGYTIITWND